MMEYVYAALLLHSAGKEINDAAITAILEAAGIKPDVAKVKALVSSLEGVNIDEAIKQSTTVPVAAPAPTEEKKEEEKKQINGIYLNLIQKKEQFGKVQTGQLFLIHPVLP